MCRTIVLPLWFTLSLCWVFIVLSFGSSGDSDVLVTFFHHNGLGSSTSVETLNLIVGPTDYPWSLYLISPSLNRLYGVLLLPPLIEPKKGEG